MLGYYDGWFRWNADGEAEAGRFLHNQSAPEFDDATTIDYPDLVEEVQFEADGRASGGG